MKRDNLIRRILKEELTKTDAKNAAKDYAQSSDFEKRVREIIASSISDLFKEMYYRNSIWQSAVKK